MVFVDGAYTCSRVYHYTRIRSVCARIAWQTCNMLYKYAEYLYSLFIFAESLRIREHGSLQHCRLFNTVLRHVAAVSAVFAVSAVT